MIYCHRYGARCGRETGGEVNWPHYVCNELSQTHKYTLGPLLKKNIILWRIFFCPKHSCVHFFPLPIFIHSFLRPRSVVCLCSYLWLYIACSYFCLWLIPNSRCHKEPEFHFFPHWSDSSSLKNNALHKCQQFWRPWIFVCQKKARVFYYVRCKQLHTKVYIKLLSFLLFSRKLYQRFFFLVVGWG